MKLNGIIKGEALPSADRKKPNMVVVWIIIAAIVILAVSGFSGEEKTESVPEKSSVAEEYVRHEEKRLEQILKKINGAGEVSVYIKIDGGGEKVLARDSKSRIDEAESEGERSEESESHVVTGGKSSAAEPFVIRERTPEITGVLVVAEGAASERIRTEIYEAVKALYGMAAHRIKVTH